MNLSYRRLPRARNRSTSSARRGRACSIEVGQLEGRLMLAGDVTAPVTSVQVVPDTLSSTGFYTSSPETINLVASDPDSPNGLTTFYNVDNTGFVAGNTLKLTDGSHTLQFYSVDQSGNREDTQTRTFNIDSTAPVVTATANPTSLWPPNHKLVDVTVTGHVTDASGGVPGTVSYHVVDEYGQVQPSGTASVDANGNYSFVVALQASRHGSDMDGRQYSIVVSATDQAGNTGTATTSVVVPHDQRNHRGHRHHERGNDNGNGNGNGNGDHGNHGHGHKNHGNGDNDNNNNPAVAVNPSQSEDGNHGHGNRGNHGHDNNDNQGNDNGNNDDNKDNNGHHNHD